MARSTAVLSSVFVVLALILIAGAQDTSTSAVRGVVADAGGARISGARVVITHISTGVARSFATDSEGVFAAQMLLPAEYMVHVEAPRMATQERRVTLELGAEVELHFRLAVAGVKEAVTVAGGTPIVETLPSAISSVLDERAITDLPLNGRRFSDLALLSPGVVQDPRSLTSGSNGDLAFGGLRGMHTSFLVDGADNNNGFFAQARGRYRAPYQFSNEVIQEFRISSNTYGAELGRSGGAVINVATKSGSNHVRGSAFYYVRDSEFNARNPFVDSKPADRQQQFGMTIGGPIKRNRVFYFGGFDQHVFHVPTVVQFLNGATTVTPGKDDFEKTDQALVTATAQSLSQMGGAFRSSLLGNAGFAKLDFVLSPQQVLNVRLNTSRYYGANNVFFDPASPVTTYAISENGEEDVATETAIASLTSAVSYRVSSHLRLQWSRDRQQSAANSGEVQQKIYGIIDAFGRSSMLPRETREHRLYLGETVNVGGKRHTWKFGGDAVLTKTRNFYPLLYGGEYIFDDIRVNPFTFAPQTYGLTLTPLRAYAHGVSRYYTQNFGSAVSHPDSNEYAWFVQDAMRVTGHLGLTLGLRYDLQTFRDFGLQTNPLWPDSGKVPHDSNNFAPRLGFAYSFGENRPLVLRGGWGLFYARIPQIYTSTVETLNGFNRSHVYLDNADYWDRVIFPTYPSPLAYCPTSATTCLAPAAIASKMTTEISAFANDFRTPMVQQASLGLEKEVARRFAVGANYLYVHGEHLIRVRDVNLPPPVTIQYPVYSDDGTFTGSFYSVDSFAPWQTTRSASCPYPPCVGVLQRPIPQVGAINAFESAASSVYHGLTVSAQRRMTQGFYFRAGYTWARAIDDTQDALVAGSPATVQNSYSTKAERGSSVTDQRHRFVLAWVWEPRLFHREHPVLRMLLNNWKLSSASTFGSGRPVNARVVGDANLDGNTGNDRLPGYRRNAFTGPDYTTTDLRLGRKLQVSDRLRLDLLMESFNLFNRLNKRVDISDDGFLNTAAQFVSLSQTIGTRHYPAYFRDSGHFLQATNAYAPRQVQFAVKVLF